MHVGGVSIFEGPPPPFDELLAMIAGKLVLVPRYRQVVRFVPFGGQPPGVGRRPALQPRLPRPAHGAAGARRRRRAALAGRPRDVAEPRPREAAVGDLGRRGTRAGSLGDALEGPPLHGRRRRRHRSDGGAARRRARAGAAAGGRLAARAGTERRLAARAGGDRAGASTRSPPRRASPARCGRRASSRGCSSRRRRGSSTRRGWRASRRRRR